MKIKDLKPGDAILVKTEEEDLKIRKMFHDAGFKWRSGSSLLKLTYFGSCKQHRTYAYELDGDDVGGVCPEDHGDYNLIPASEFFSSLPEKWAIKIDSQEVIDVVGVWLDKEKELGKHYMLFPLEVRKREFFVYPAAPGASLWHIHPEPPIGYTRISLEEFKAAYPQEIKRGDWVYYSCDGAWEAVMQFSHERKGITYGKNAFTLSFGEGIERSDNAHARHGVRLATPEELSRIRDAYEGKVVKELRSHMKSVFTCESRMAWNEALELAISIIKNTKKI